MPRLAFSSPLERTGRQSPGPFAALYHSDSSLNPQRGMDVAFIGVHRISRPIEDLIANLAPAVLIDIDLIPFATLDHQCFGLGRRVQNIAQGQRQCIGMSVTKMDRLDIMHLAGDIAEVQMVW